MHVQAHTQTRTPRTRTHTTHPHTSGSAMRTFFQSIEKWMRKERLCASACAYGRAVTLHTPYSGTGAHPSTCTSIHNTNTHLHAHFDNREHKSLQSSLSFFVFEFGEEGHRGRSSRLCVYACVSWRVAVRACRHTQGVTDTHPLTQPYKSTPTHTHAHTPTHTHHTRTHTSHNDD